MTFRHGGGLPAKGPTRQGSTPMHKPNPFEYRKPITLDTLDDLFSHHHRITGGWTMTSGAPGGGGDGDGSGGGGTGGQGTGSGGGGTGGQGTGSGGGGTGGQGTGSGGGGDGAGAGAGGPGAAGADSNDLGFPPDTPIAEMTLAQQANYHKHQARKWQANATEYRTAAGGKTAAEVKAEMAAAEQARQAALTEQQRAVEEAKGAGKSEAESVWRERAVRASFDIALSEMTPEERVAALDVLDLSKFVSESGEVDTDKVRQHAERIAPGKGGGQTPRFDFGAGKRGDTKAQSGVAAGASLFEQRHPKKTTTATP